MVSSTTEALVLRTVDFGESDRIVHLLTPESARLTAIAKGARRSKKRFGGTLDLFHHLRIQVVRRSTSRMARLEGAVLIEPFAALRTSAARFALGCYLLELLARLAPEGGARADARRLFGFALRALHTLASSDADGRLRLWLELHALDALGLRPELRRCVRCGEEARAARDVGFHVAEGGPVCERCEPRQAALLRVHLGTLRALEQGLRFELSQVGRLALAPPALEEARRLVDRFARFHLGLELRSERFLDEIMPSGAAPAA
ncbi:MAG TPA: DNA repair protein RecO [Myxococcota bacterium]|nr:DNA repair protein RecO [Myxococcota bacterium]